MKSLEPYNRKLGMDTWYYAKRCFLALIEGLVWHRHVLERMCLWLCRFVTSQAKQMFVLNDATYHEVLEFFDACEGIYAHTSTNYCLHARIRQAS